MYLRYIYRVLSAVVLLLLPQGLSAQYSYNHQEGIMNQFMCMEQAYGNLDGWPWFLDSNYKNNANYEPLGAREVQRMKVQGYFRSESRHAESVDTIYRERLKNLGIEALGRSVDLDWMTERGKIESQLSVLQRNLGRIVSSGGTMEDYRHWTEKYNMIVQNALPMVRDSYQPGYKRNEEYQRVYDDLYQCNKDLSDMFYYWAGLKVLESMRGVSPTPIRSRSDSIARIALSKWKVKYNSSLSAAPKERRVRYTWTGEGSEE